jgi:formylglycine-generating enzyme required for sulfatase activity
VYRRDDSRWSAGRISDRLVDAFGADRVFFDTLAIEPGEDFHVVIGAHVGACKVLLAVIGQGWIEALAKKAGDSNDFVRIEIAEALRRVVRVVPVLIDGASLPLEASLPDDLRPLARRHAFTISADGFRADADRLCGFLKSFLDGPRAPERQPASAFEAAPNMIEVPAGSFMMGSPRGEGAISERPLHKVVIKRAFAVGIAPVTRGEFAAFVAVTDHNAEDGSNPSWRNPGFPQENDHPVVHLNWHDAQAYVAWLRERSGGKAFRLLSEAEWEYCCRAGTTTPYSTGDTISPAQANFNTGGTTPVTKFPPSPWGLRDMHGNVWEWCEDNWHEDYSGDPPSDGSVWPGGDVSIRVLRGGSWSNYPQFLRSAYRSRYLLGERISNVGFRVARTL